MRRMLGLLRAGDELTGTRPQPGLADLDGLLAQHTLTGMRLAVEVERPLPEVGPGTGLAVYRLVQEALTNVHRHAGPDAQVRVTLRRAGADLLVAVVDDGRGAAAPSDGRGHGLVGMRERVAVLGGTLEAGPAEGGGFAVRARLPLTGAGS
jgi:signal transduction histidine kinase